MSDEINNNTIENQEELKVVYENEPKEEHSEENIILEEYPDENSNPIEGFEHTGYAQLGDYKTKTVIKVGFELYLGNVYQITNRNPNEFLGVLTLKYVEQEFDSIGNKFVNFNELLDINMIKMQLIDIIENYGEDYILKEYEGREDELEDEIMKKLNMHIFDEFQNEYETEIVNSTYLMIKNTLGNISSQHKILSKYNLKLKSLLNAYLNKSKVVLIVD